MVKSILANVKQSLDLSYDGDDGFDDRLLSEIQNQFGELGQLTKLDALSTLEFDVDTTYSDILGELPDDIDKDNLIMLIHNLINISVRLSFDPPTSASIQTSLEKTRNNLQHRIVYNFENAYEF